MKADPLKVAPLNVIVIGAGIGGLATTVALRRSGFQVEVYERRSGPATEFGTGLTLWTNAMRALAAIGLAEPVRAASVVLESFDNVTATGRSIASWPLAAGLTRYGQPNVNITRSALHRVLTDALGDQGVRTGRTCVGVRAGTAGVRALFDDGGSVEADVLVGADGASSTVRSALLPAGRPRYTGYPVWRALVDVDHPAIAGAVHRQWWGRGARFGCYRVGPTGQLYWWATSMVAEPEVEPPADRHRVLLDIFGGWAEPVPDILLATEPAAIHRSRVYHAPELVDWGVGRATLLGDAAHAMTFNIGQGACQAIEDAVVLADRLAGAADVCQALREYEGQRRARTRPMVRRARLIGRLGMLRGRVSTAARDAALRWVLPGPAFASHWRDMSVPLPSLSAAKGTATGGSC